MTERRVRYIIEYKHPDGDWNVSEWNSHRDGTVELEDGLAVLAHARKEAKQAFTYTGFLYKHRLIKRTTTVEIEIVDE